MKRRRFVGEERQLGARHWFASAKGKIVDHNPLALPREAGVIQMHRYEIRRGDLYGNQILPMVYHLSRLHREAHREI